eukprot:15346845-Heterocapsa_arctica.AAC.1
MVQARGYYIFGFTDLPTSLPGEDVGPVRAGAVQGSRKSRVCILLQFVCFGSIWCRKGHTSHCQQD